MQELIYLGAQLGRSARQLKLVFGRCCPAYRVFRRLYQQLAPA
jgi:hypothetical protein